MRKHSIGQSCGGTLNSRPRLSSVIWRTLVPTRSVRGANVCRIAQTPNEVIIDFGLNPNFFGQILDEPLKLEQRVILSHDAAKRLCLHLTATIQNFEAKYGPIELDVTKRLKQAPPAT